MKSGRTRGAIHIPLVITLIVAGAVSLCLIFFFFAQKLNRKVEDILCQQFNQQQLMLARKIADNVEAYFDYLENELEGYVIIYQLAPPDSPLADAFLNRWFKESKHFGILAQRRYDSAGVLQATIPETGVRAAGKITLAPNYLHWAQEPEHRGKLLMAKTRIWPDPPWQGRRLLRLLTPLYSGEEKLAGVVELIIDPMLICRKVTEGVRSGQTGYAWMVDQDRIILAHYEKDFVGKGAIATRRAKNPNLSFEKLEDLLNRLLRGEEGTGEYVSGWHRQKIGIIEKLAAFTPIRFDKGLIRGVMEVEDPEHNLWGVAVVAPKEEVSGQVWEVLRQEFFLTGLFFLLIVTGSGVLIGLTLTFNKRLAREVELKTRELKESQELLVRSERFVAVGEAAAYVSHEIKNPLMVIGGLAQQVSRRLEERPELQEKLNIIQGEVRRLENFLGELRDFTRPVRPTKESINLNQIIHEVYMLMDAEARKRNVTIRENLDSRLPRLEADPGQMKQVLLNLIKNSLEAMDSGGEIALNSGADRHHVWFSVRDTGCGMPPEVLEKVFDPFFTTKQKGTGLGLAVINKIILDHQGMVTVESEPGKGTTFTVKLPYQA